MKEIETWSEMKIAGACMNIIWFEGTCDVFVSAGRGEIYNVVGTEDRRCMMCVGCSF